MGTGREQDVRDLRESVELKVLFVSASNPYAETAGADLRLRTFLEGAARRYEVDLLCLAERTRIEKPGPGPLARLETRRFRASGRIKRLLRSLTLRLPDLALRSSSRDMAIAFYRRLLLDDYSAVHIAGLQMAYLVDVFRAAFKSEPKKPTLIFDDLNAEYVVHRRMSSVETRRGRRLRAAYSAAQDPLLRAYETKVIRSADVVICPSSDDRDWLRALDASARIEVAPSGLNTKAYVEVPPPAETPVAVFVGDQTYRPNRQAADWLESKIAPAVWRTLPEAEFVIVGKGYRPSATINGAGTFRYAGYVSDITSVIEASKVVLAPLLAGGGIKLKVLEGMAAGRPVVTTSVGAAGIAAKGGRDLVVADGVEAYARALVSVLSDTARARELGNAARRRVTALYDSTVVGSTYVEVLEQTMSPADV